MNFLGFTLCFCIPNTCCCNMAETLPIKPNNQAINLNTFILWLIVWQIWDDSPVPSGERRRVGTQWSELPRLAQAAPADVRSRFHNNLKLYSFLFLSSSKFSLFYHIQNFHISEINQINMWLTELNYYMYKQGIQNLKPIINNTKWLLTTLFLKHLCLRYVTP